MTAAASKMTSFSIRSRFSAASSSSSSFSSRSQHQQQKRKAKSNSNNNNTTSANTIRILVISIWLSMIGIIVINQESMYRRRINELESDLYRERRRMNNNNNDNNNNNNFSTMSSSQLIDLPPTLVDNTNTDVNADANKVRFIPHQELRFEYGRNDFFSAAWWQSVDRFLQLDIPRYVYTVEDNAMKAIIKAGRGTKDVRMTRDWLDFNVEHLSKWWKIDKMTGASRLYAIGKLQAYIASTLSYVQQHQQHQNKTDEQQQHNTMTMKSTIAILPIGVGSEIDVPIWSTSLAATIASLIKQGIGRIVVVGYYSYDPIVCRNAFWYLLRYHPDYQRAMYTIRRKNPTKTTGGLPNHFRIPKTSSQFSVKYGDTELAYWTTNDEDVKTQYIKTNVPRGAMIGLHNALTSSGNTITTTTTTNKDTNTNTNTTRKIHERDVTAWLGTNHKEERGKYKYVFLTEADQIFNTRLETETSSSLGRAFQQELDDGRILVPHRMQPIPHRLDLEGISINSDEPESSEKMKFVIYGLSDVEEFVIDLDARTDSCCDTNTHLSSKAKYGMDGFWWQHGFNRGVNKSFEYLKEYDFVRQVHGTGIVNLAATSHSRKCLPRIRTRSCS